MAFSMFLRNTGCSSRLFSQQVMKMATQPALTQRVLTPTMLNSISLKMATNPTLLSAVRSFRTTAVCQASGHDHSKLWLVEKVTTAAILPLLGLTLLMPNKLVDSALAVLIVAHTFWGLEAIAMDYARPATVGFVLSKAAIVTVYALCISVLGGLFYLINHDIGIGNTIKKIWAIKPAKSA